MSVKVNVTLRPIVTKDEETGFFVAELPNFPNMISYDESELVAVKRLIGLFEAMLRDRREEVISIIGKIALSQKSEFHHIKLSKISNTENCEENVELEMATA